MRILLVDDEPALGLLFDRMLRQMGHEVVFTDDPEQALVLVDGVDAVVSDIEMPKMNGVELAAAIREKNGQMPICFCTGSDPEDAIVKTASGFGRVLQKDGRPETFKAILLELSRQMSARGSADLPPVRRWPRIQLALAVKIRYGNLAEAIEARTANVSRNGVYINTTEPRPVNTAVRLTILIEEPFATYALAGRVVRVDPGAGMAIEITNTTPDWESFCRGFRDPS